MARLLENSELSRQMVDLPGWADENGTLRRSVTAPDFLTGVALVQDVATVAESMDHHPDIDIRWRTVTFVLSTHSAGGVTQLDVELAHHISELAAARQAS